MKVRNSFDRIELKLMNDMPEKQAKQAFKNECDINHLMAKYEQTGLLPQVHTKSPIYADVSGVGDYLESVQRIQAAEEAFSSLPAKVRKHFKNSPAALLAALEDESRKQELIDIGVLQSSAGVKKDEKSEKATQSEAPAAKAAGGAP